MMHRIALIKIMAAEERYGVKDCLLIVLAAEVCDATSDAILIKSRAPDKISLTINKCK